MFLSAFWWAMIVCLTRITSMSTSDALDEINHILQWECRESMNFDYFLWKNVRSGSCGIYVLWRLDRWQMQKWPFCSIMVWFSKIKTGSLQNITKKNPVYKTRTRYTNSSHLFYLFSINMNIPTLDTSELLVNTAHWTPILYLSAFFLRPRI